LPTDERAHLRIPSWLIQMSAYTPPKIRLAGKNRRTDPDGTAFLRFE